MSFSDLARQVPRFTNQILGLVSGPKRFATRLDLQALDTLPDALILYVIALMINFILESPFVSLMQEFWTAAALTAVFHVLALFILTSLLFISWRIVGGKGDFRGHLILTLYFWGISVVIWSLSAFAARGVMKVLRPESFNLYEEYMEFLFLNSNEIKAERFGALHDSNELLFSMFVLLAGFLVLLAWFIATWGAFRSLNDQTRVRSLGAMLLFLILAYPIHLLLTAGQYAAGINIF